jgi:hypothetical protein
MRAEMESVIRSCDEGRETEVVEDFMLFKVISVQSGWPTIHCKWPTSHVSESFKYSLIKVIHRYYNGILHLSLSKSIHVVDIS